MQLLPAARRPVVGIDGQSKAWCHDVLGLWRAVQGGGPIVFHSQAIQRKLIITPNKAARRTQSTNSQQQSMHCGCGSLEQISQPLLTHKG